MENAIFRPTKLFWTLFWCCNVAFSRLLRSTSAAGHGAVGLQVKHYRVLPFCPDLAFPTRFSKPKCPSLGLLACDLKVFSCSQPSTKAHSCGACHSVVGSSAPILALSSVGSIHLSAFSCHGDSLVSPTFDGMGWSNTACEYARNLPAPAVDLCKLRDVSQNLLPTLSLHGCCSPKKTIQTSSSEPESAMYGIKGIANFAF